MAAHCYYTERVVDNTTGEELITKTQTREFKSPEHFTRLFLEDMKSLKQLSHAEYRMLINMSPYLEYNTNKFFLNKERRIELAELSQLKVSTVNQCLARLINKDLLIKVGSGQYQMNPNIFFTGDDIARTAIMKHTIEYIRDKNYKDTATPLESYNRILPIIGVSPYAEV